MRIRYSISLWNFTHYTHIPNLERIVPLVREQGYGIELWGRSQDEEDLYDEIGRRRIKGLVEGMTLSLHTRSVAGFEGHKKQIDAAADWGAEVVVLHPPGIGLAQDKRQLDVELACKVVQYAEQCGVKLALENGSLGFLVNALEKVDGLGFCLDTGHVYNQGDDMADYLSGLKDRLIHLHLQDVLQQAENGLPMTGQDHYTPGTGGIRAEDWRLIAETLREIDFDGIAVFEIRPRTVFQTARLGEEFFRKLLRR